MGNGYLCPNCKVLVCRTCRVKVQANEIGPEMLINDNWISYIEDFIYMAKVTWMEKTIAMPFWTSMLMFAVDSKRGGRKKRTMHNVMYQSQSRISHRGQVFSAP